MSQLEGFVIPKKPEYACKLHKSFYELKQAPHAWFEKLRSTLFNWGFKELEADTSLFIYREVCNSIFFYLCMWMIFSLLGITPNLVIRLIHDLNF